MKVSYLGTTVLLFDDGVDQIMFDAHVTRPPLWKYVLNARVQTNAALADEIIERYQMERLRAIFVSHAHHDHVMDAPYFARRCGAAVYGSESVLNVCRGGGVSEDRLVEFCGGESFELGGFEVRVIPSLHSKLAKPLDDLGQKIGRPLAPPARLREYKEGGSFDFYLETADRRILIRPSCNYIEGQLDGLQADVLFLGIGGMTRQSDAFCEAFFRETVEKVGAKLVIPIHWDNFFSGLDRPAKRMPRFMDKTERGLFTLARYCEAHGVGCLVQLPRTSIEL
ncbi:MAG: MBL fold metallo-hydrolase [Coriobacteriales bacterium]|nr:MBL fold metallo-hydrolase [Coriobacteriales bacterium]